MKYGTFKYGTRKYGIWLYWKSWGYSDNYATQGTIELERLISNSGYLLDVLATEFGFSNIAATPTTDGYSTLPVTTLLNQVEGMVDALKKFDVDYPDSRTWVVSPISFEDINRWENTGLITERNIVHGRTNFNMCGKLIAGRVR